MIIPYFIKTIKIKLFMVQQKTQKIRNSGIDRCYSDLIVKSNNKLGGWRTVRLTSVAFIPVLHGMSI